MASTFKFGIYITAETAQSKKYSPFAVKLSNFADFEERFVITEVYETKDITEQKKALAQAKRIYNKKYKKQQNVSTEDGKLVYFCDESFHYAILIEQGKKRSKLLFITSNPHWNSKSRKLTEEELALLGMPIKSDTYFAPVVRPNDNISFSQNSFPEHRIKDLKEEFFS